VAHSRNVTPGLDVYLGCILRECLKQRFQARQGDLYINGTGSLLTLSVNEAYLVARIPLVDYQP